MISVKNVSFKYPGSNERVLQDISFNIDKGSFVAIIGGNGSGKSTLCKSLVGLIPQHISGEFEGEITIDDLKIVDENLSEVAKKVGYVYQDFENQLVRPLVKDEVEFAPLNFGYEDYKEKAKKALKLVGMEHLQNEFIWQLSGGQKHLLAIATVLAMDPDVLILDEPIAQLDPLHGQAVYDLLKKLNEEYHKTILVIEHHTRFIKKYCHEIISLNNGQMQYHLPIAQAFNKIEDLIQASLLTKETYSCQAEDLGIQKSQVLLAIENLSHQYRSVDRSINTSLKGINLTFREGEKVALIGGNGAGKSTLLKLMTGLIRLKHGDIKINEESIKSYSLQQLASNITYLYQNPEDMFLQESIKKDVELFPTSRGKEDMETLCEYIMSEFNLEQFKHRDGRLLSGGQQRRATLAIGMAMTPSVMLLDEPTASLDVNSRNELFKLLTLLKEQIKVVVIATHDLSLVYEWANRVIVMNQGEVVLDTTPHQFMTSNLDVKKWGILKEVGN
ncbi:MAG: ABC transporter ATP-binding protein [Turicibacter sp.]